jgi:hypothetical protein
MPGSDDDVPLTVSVGHQRDAVITLGPALPRAVDGYEFIDFWLSIEGAGLKARTIVRTIEGGTGPYCLTQFVAELADDWKGDLPTRDFESIEHDLSIASSRDPVGHVILRFTLRESYRAESWEVSVTAELDAGEEMSAFACAVRDLLGSA